MKYGCKLDVCCSGFFVIALVAVPVSSVRYTHCVSILAHNAVALSRARWNNDTIRSTIAARRRLNRLAQYFSSSFFFFFLFNSSVTELRNPFSHFTDQGGIIRVDRAGQFALDRRSDHLEFTFAIDQVKFDEYDFVSNLFEFHLFQNVCLWISCLSLKNVQGKRERKSFSHLVEWDKIVRVGGI